MKGKFEITIDGVAYPCRPTMGAMLRFKRETGKELTEMESKSISELCTFLYCCVASASAAEGREFNLSLMEFADRIDPAQLNAWSERMDAANSSEAVQADGEKKS